VSSVWKIEIGERASRELRKLNRQTAKRILGFLQNRLAQRDDPRDLGRPLRGRLAPYWRYRVGDHRIVAQIVDERVVVLVLRIGHHKDDSS